MAVVVGGFSINDFRRITYPLKSDGNVIPDPTKVLILGEFYAHDYLPEIAVRSSQFYSMTAHNASEKTITASSQSR